MGFSLKLRHIPGRALKEITGVFRKLDPNQINEEEEILCYKIKLVAPAAIAAVLALVAATPNMKIGFIKIPNYITVATVTFVASRYFIKKIKSKDVIIGIDVTNLYLKIKEDIDEAKEGVSKFKRRSKRVQENVETKFERIKKWILSFFWKVNKKQKKS